MGRRRKHSGDSGLASDQFPGQNQNNIKYQALSLSAVPPPGLSQQYTCGLYRTRNANASLTLGFVRPPQDIPHPPIARNIRACLFKISRERFVSYRNTWTNSGQGADQLLAFTESLMDGNSRKLFRERAESCGTHDHVDCGLQAERFLISRISL